MIKLVIRIFTYRRMFPVYLKNLLNTVVHVEATVFSYSTEGIYINVNSQMHKKSLWSNIATGKLSNLILISSMFVNSLLHIPVVRLI